MTEVYFPQKLDGDGPALLKWANSVDPSATIIFSDCRGGAVLAGLAAANLLRGHQGKAVVEATCAGAHLLPVAAIQRRFVTPYAQLGFRRTRAEAMGTAEELSRVAKQVDLIDTEMQNFLGKYLGVAPRIVGLWMQEGRWLDADDCLAHGIAQRLDSHGEAS